MQTAFDLDQPQGLRTVDSPAVGFSHRNAGKTERAAAKKQVLSKTRRIVLSALVEAGSHGLTRHEISDRTGLPLQSVCGRVKECLDEKWAFSTYRSRSGRAVLIATDRGKQAVRQTSRPSPLTNQPAPSGVKAKLTNPRQGVRLSDCSPTEPA